MAHDPGVRVLNGGGLNSYPKVVGLIQASNEWPLLALSISHALMHHVDEVYVLNHSSTDGSCEGTRRLQELWPDRIHVFDYADEHFWQEACLSVLIELSRDASPDWIYVFDADEFMITRDGGSLKEVLKIVHPEYPVVRYEVENWVSTADFDESDLACYRLLRYRSTPSLSLDMSIETRVDEIRNGNVNYFDLPFASKAVFRNNEALWISAGAHRQKVLPESRQLEMRSDGLRVVHLPLLSRGRLVRRATTGRLEVQDRFPAGHGWQNQMIWAFSQEGKLDEFWANHSIAVGSPSEDRTPPSFVVDDGFVRAIEPVLRFLEDGLESKALRRRAEQDLSSPDLVDSRVSFRTAVHLSRRLQVVADSMREEREALVGLKDTSRGVGAPARVVGRLSRRARGKAGRLVGSVAPCLTRLHGRRSDESGKEQ